MLAEIGGDWERTHVHSPLLYVAIVRTSPIQTPPLHPLDKGFNIVTIFWEEIASMPIYLLEKTG